MISNSDRMVLVLFGLFILAHPSCAHAPARNYTGLFYSQRDSTDTQAMERTFRDWKDFSPKDPEIPAAEGYLKWDKARLKEKGAQTTGELPLLRYPHREGTFQPNGWNQDDLHSAEKAWKLALQTQPNRLDLTLKLSLVEQALGRFEAQYALLAKVLQKIDRKDGPCQWIPGRDVPATPQNLLSDALLESEAYWFCRGPEGVEYASRLARLAMTYNDQDPLPYNCLAVCHLIRGNPQHALKCLLIALRRDPTNCLVLGNIGRLLASIGKKREAGIYFSKVVSLNKDPDESLEAQNYLLSGKKPP